MTTKINGKIKWFNADKGFGFITPDDPTVNDGKDLFLHVTTLRKSGVREADAKDGAAVAFTIGENRGKSVAENIELRG